MKKSTLLPIVAIAGFLGCSESAAPPPAPAPTPAAAAPPPAAPAAPGKAEEYRPPAKEFLSYKTPPEWVGEKPDGMRKAQYRIPDKNGKEAAAVLTFFSMAPQSVEKMSEYWGGHMGGADAKVTKIEGAAATTHLLDFSGTYSGEGGSIENARFLGAMIETSGNTWYLKFVGPAGTVGGWKDAFVEMLKTLRPVE